MKIKADRYAQYKKDFGGMIDCEPADLYGKRVNLDKNDSTNLGKTADDIKDVYCLESSPTEKDMGGLAVEDNDNY